MEKSWGYWKPEAGGLSPNPENIRELLTPGNINRSSSNTSIPTLKPSNTQGPTRSRARHTTQILQQHRNIALSFNIQAAQSQTKPTDISKLITGHFIALQREEIQLYPPEHRHKLPSPGKLDKPLVQPHPQWGNATIKRTPQIARIRKGHPKHRNINKMKRQRNTQQVKEQDKCPPNQTKEEEIGNLPEKESQIIISENDPKSWKQNGVTDK